MNLACTFRPSRQLGKPTIKTVASSETDLREQAESVAPATKSVDELSLSEEELKLCQTLAEDATEGQSRLYINGRLVRIGLTWQAGGEELWNSK